MAPRFRSVAGALASGPVAGVLRWTRVSILLASGSVVGVLLFFTTAGARKIFRDRLLLEVPFLPRKGTKTTLVVCSADGDLQQSQLARRAPG